MSGVFISHASADKNFVDDFVDDILRLGCGIPVKEIFYSGRVSTGVRSGENLNSRIQFEVADADLVIAVLTPTYQKRPYCLAELGAAWSRTGVLLPIAAPGLELTDLDGVLKGILVRHADDSAALDELHDQVCDMRDGRPSATNWGECKAKWMAKVGGLAASLPRERVIALDDYDRLKADHEGAMAALASAQKDIRNLKVTVEQLKLAKDKEEIRRILKPDTEVAEYEQCEHNAREALRPLKSVVRDAVYWDMRSSEMPWPRDQGDRQEADDALAAGQLKEGWTEDSLRANEAHPTVSKAIDAAAELRSFLSSDTRSEEFEGWFRAEHDQMPPDLSMKDAWDKIINLSFN